MTFQAIQAMSPGFQNYSASNLDDYEYDLSDEAEIERVERTRKEGLVYHDYSDEVGYDDLDDPQKLVDELGLG